MSTITSKTPKYAWYFINKGDDVCKHVNYKLLTYNLQRISARSSHLTLFTVLIFFKINVWLVIWLTKFCILKPCYCTRWNCYPGGVLPYMANTGMCCWTEHCQSTESRHTRHKRAIIKRQLISANRNIHPYIIRIRTPRKFKLSFLDLITGRHNTVLA